MDAAAYRAKFFRRQQSGKRSKKINGLLGGPLSVGGWGV